MTRDMTAWQAIRWTNRLYKAFFKALFTGDRRDFDAVCAQVEKDTRNSV